MERNGPAVSNWFSGEKSRKIFCTRAFDVLWLDASQNECLVPGCARLAPAGLMCGVRQRVICRIEPAVIRL